MKKLIEPVPAFSVCLIFALIFLPVKRVHSQLIAIKDFGSISLGDFSNPEFNTKDRLQYPYLDVGLVVQNTEGLSNPDFLRRFNRVTHFFTEIKARYNGENFSVPIILMQKERNDRGAFVSVNNISNKVFEKIPLVVDADVSPNFSISNTITIQNGLVNALKMLTDNANNLLSLDIKNSLNKPREVLSFVSKVLGGLETRTFSVTSSFTPFMFDDPVNNKIYDFKLVAVIPPNEQPQFAKENFTVKRDGSDIKLLYGQDEFTYPYCLLVLSLSNYLHLEGLPSAFLDRNPLTNLSQQKIDEMNEAMIKNNSRLSLSQGKNEAYLIAYLQTYLAMKTGENIQRQPGSTDRDLKLIGAYNYWFDFSDLEKSFVAMQGSRRTLYNKYLRWTLPIKEAIHSSAGNLDHADLCYKVYGVKKIDCDKITNAHLIKLNQFKNTATGLTYLQQVKFSYDVEGKVSECETYLYEHRFKSACNELGGRDQHAAQRASENLKRLKNLYPNCKVCQEKVFEAEKQYESLSAANKVKEVNLIVIRAGKTLADFESESNNWIASNTATIQDSKDSTGVAKLKFDFAQPAYDADLILIKSYQQKFDKLKDSKNKSDAESLEKELNEATEKFRKNYYKALVTR